MRKYLGGAALAALAMASWEPAHADAIADAQASKPLDEVIVTATKRETNVQKTPIAISVVGTEAIQERHVQSLINLADGAIPSLRIATFEARQSALTVGIRGIVPFDANQTARDIGVGVYVDGVYLGRPQGLNAALFDIERIEVLRGPQGTLFGRNTEGGALSIVTKAPTGKFDGRFTGGYGNYGAYNSEAHIDFPAFANVAVKVDGLVQHQNATVENPLAGQTGWNFYNRVGGRISARWTPIENLIVDVAYDNARDENTPFYSQLVNYNPLGKTVRTVAQMQASPTIPSGFIAPLPPLAQVHADRQTTAEIGVPQQPSIDDTNGFSGNIKYKLLPNLELRSITAWRGVTTNQWDNSGGAHRVPFTPNGAFSRYSLSELHQRQFSEEVQAVGSIPQLDYVAGFYYFEERADEVAATPATNQWNADGTGYTIRSQVVSGAITSGNQGWNRDQWFLQRGSWAKAQSYAGFGQFTFTPAQIPALHLTAGGRYTQDKRNGVLWIVQGKASNFTFNFNKGHFDPMVTLGYDVTPDVNVYAKYSTGYRAGGANDRSQTFQAFDPEEVKAYEIGVKADFLDHRLRVNLAGYAMDRTNTQTDFDNVDTNPLSPTFNLHTEETRNAPGVSQIRGFEAELLARPIDNMTVGVSYSYTSIKVPPAPYPFTGNSAFPPGSPFPVYTVFTPPNAASAYVDYTLPIPGHTPVVKFHLDGNYADAQYSFQSESVKTDKSFVMNGRVALAQLPLGGSTGVLSLWSRNLLNESHIYRRSAANAGTLGDYANFSPPRTYGIELQVSF